MEAGRIAPYKIRERENKNKIGKQPSAGEENLASKIVFKCSV